MGDWGEIGFAPLLPWWGVALLLGALLVPTGFALWRRARGGWWRLAALVALGISLANPLWLREQRRPDDDIALLLVDRSDSQKLAGRLDAVAEAAAALTAQPLDHLLWRRVDLVSKPGDHGTPLFEALGAALRDIPAERLAGAILLTDGIVSDDPAGVGLQPPGAPVHAILTGDPAMLDRALAIDRIPGFALVGHSTPIPLKIDDGPRPPVPVRLRWSVDGGAEHILETMSGETVEIELIPGHAGDNPVLVTVEPLAGEVNLANNQALIPLHAVRDRLRVLLVSGEPYPGERLWRATLKSDPAVDLVHFTILRLPSSRDPTPSRELALIPFPTRQLFEDKLGEFDLVIFDRYTLRGVLEPRYLANLRDHVEKGGAVLVAVGPEFSQRLNLGATALGDILPAEAAGGVVEQGFRPALSAIGQRHPVTSTLPEAWGQSPWGRWYRLIEARATRGEVLITGPGGAPLLVVDRVGEGRIGLILSDQSWLWGRGVDGGGPQTELYRRLAHWLMKEPELEEEALFATASGLNLDIRRRSLDPGDAEVTITAPDGGQTTLTLSPAGDGEAKGRISVEQPGIYQIDDGQRHALVAALAADAEEAATLRPRADRVSPLVTASGGGVYWLKDGLPTLQRVGKSSSAASRQSLGLRENHAGQVLGISTQPLLPAWLGLGLVLGLIGLAWWRESR